jgi:hypothetical protein
MHKLNNYKPNQNFLKFRKRFFPSQVTTKKRIYLKQIFQTHFQIYKNFTLDIPVNTRKYYYQDHRHEYWLLDSTYDTVKKIN